MHFVYRCGAPTSFILSFFFCFRQLQLQAVYFVKSLISVIVIVSVMQCFGSFWDHYTLTVWHFQIELLFKITRFVSCFLDKRTSRSHALCIHECYPFLCFLTFSVFFSTISKFLEKRKKEPTNHHPNPVFVEDWSLITFNAGLLCRCCCYCWFVARFFEKNLMFSKSSGFFYPIRQIGQQIETKQKRKQMKRNEEEEDQEHTSIFVDFIYSTKKERSTLKTIGVFPLALLPSPLSLSLSWHSDVMTLNSKFHRAFFRRNWKQRVEK